MRYFQDDNVRVIDGQDKEMLKNGEVDHGKNQAKIVVDEARGKQRTSLDIFVKNLLKINKMFQINITVFKILSYRASFL